MGSEIDRLEVKVEAQATKANNQIDKLVAKLNVLSSSLSNVNSGGLTGLSSGVSKFAQASTQLSNVKTADFTRLAKNIEKIGTMDSVSLVNSATSLSKFTTALRSLDSVAVSDNVQQIGTLAKGISQLGYKSSTKAIENIPKLASSMKQLIITLSGVPKVSQNLIDMTNALANLSRTGASSGRAANSLAKSLDTYTYSTGKASRGTFSLASALGKLYATYWVVFRALSKIGEAIDISSDLTEVQNVVDVTFGNMAYKVEKLAQTSIEQFGMSELALKQYASRFQAMGAAMGIDKNLISNANSFLSQQTNGYIELSDSLSDVSLNLTKLTADMASFYNVEQSDVAEDLSSVYTGMTRPLRQYGLDLTEATLKEWAMNNGLDANIDSMTQAEKTMLRYQYVLANTGAAQGDFARTADTWANQVRILKQNFQQLASVIGGVFINALKPLVKALNAAMSHIIAFAKTISNALGKIFGWKYEEGSGGFASDFDDVADSTGDISDNLAGAADSAKKMRSYLLGIDELNVIEPEDTSSSSGSSGAGTGGVGGSGTGTDGGWSKTDSIFKDYESDIDTLYELGEYIRDALIGVMESIDWESIYEKARGFGKGLAEFLNGLLAYDGEGRTLFGTVGKTFANTLNAIVYSALEFAKEFDFYQFGVNLADGINEFFRNFDFIALAKTLNEWVDGFKDVITGFLETLTWEDIISGITDFLGALELDTVEFIIGAFVLKQKGSELKNMIKVAILGKLGLQNITLSGLVLSLPSVLGINFSSASFQVIGAQIVEEIEKVLDAILPEWFTNWIGEFIAGFSIGGALSAGNPFVAILSGLISGIPFKDIIFDVSWAEYWFDEMISSFNEIANEKDWLGIGIRIIEGIAEGLMGALAFIIQPIHNLFMLIWDGICDVFGIHSPAENMKPLGENILFGVVEGFINAFESFSSAISDFFDTCVYPWFNIEKWEAIFGNIKVSLNNVWGNLVKWWEDTAIYNWYNNSVKPWFDLEKWTEMYSTIKTALNNVWDELVTWWNNTAIYRWYNDNVKPWFNVDKWTFSGIKEGLSNAFNSAVDAIKSIWNEFANWLNDALTFTFDGIELPNGETIASFEVCLGKLPTFQTGGFPEDGLFMANHGELVGKFSNGRTAVANNEMIIAGIEEAAYRGFARANAENNRQEALLEELISAVREGKSIQIDGRELVSAYDERKSRNGYSFT